MYDWRRMSKSEREVVLAGRQRAGLPWHSPPHEDRGEGAYHITAACYEHAPIIGATAERMTNCEAKLLGAVQPWCTAIYAWCLLPNHYHLLVDTARVEALLKELGQFHGRTSYEWNGQDAARGRQVWHGSQERAMRSNRHFWATMNYVHNNPVRHGYVRRWQDWPFSSARQFLEEMGREEAERIWREYPVLDYGEGWDDAAL